MIIFSVKARMISRFNFEKLYAFVALFKIDLLCKIISLCEVVSFLRIVLFHKTEIFLYFICVACGGMGDYYE